MAADAIPGPSGDSEETRTKLLQGRSLGQFTEHRARAFPINSGTKITQGRQAYVGTWGPVRAGSL